MNYQTVARAKRERSEYVVECSWRYHQSTCCRRTSCDTLDESSYSVQPGDRCSTGEPSRSLSVSRPYNRPLHSFTRHNHNHTATKNIPFSTSTLNLLAIFFFMGNTAFQGYCITYRNKNRNMMEMLSPSSNWPVL